MYTKQDVYMCIYNIYIYIYYISQKLLSRFHKLMCSDNPREIVRFMLQLSSEPLRPSKGILGDRIQGNPRVGGQDGVRFTESVRASIYWDHCNMKSKSLTSPHESSFAGGQVDIKSSKCRQILFGFAVFPWNFHPRLCWVPLVQSLFFPFTSIYYFLRDNEQSNTDSNQSNIACSIILTYLMILDGFSVIQLQLIKPDGLSYW